MQGFFKATVHDASHLGKTPEEMDCPYLEAIKAGRLMEFLAELPVVQKVKTQNQVFNTLPAFLGRSVWGMPNLGSGFVANDDDGLAFMELSVLTTEPTYTEYSTVADTYAHSFDEDSVGAVFTLWKRFIEDHSEPHRIWIDQGGREGYYFRDRFLWLPSDGLMENIRGARTQYQENSDSTTDTIYKRSWLSRTRFKNSGGSPVTLEKLTTQSFLIEYILRFFSR